MDWRYLTRRERVELVLLSLGFVAGCAAIVWMVVRELCA